MAQFTKMQKILTTIATDHAFFSTLVYKRPPIPREDIPTLCVDQGGQIYYNKSFIESLSVQQGVFGVCHEVVHDILDHVGRVGPRNKEKWNVAADCVGNDLLIDMNVGEVIPGCVHRPGYNDRTKLVEVVYDELPDGEDEGGGGIGNDLMESGKDQTPGEQSEQRMRRYLDIQEAMNAAKSRGQMPGVLAKFLGELLESKTPWWEKVERFATEQADDSYSWNRRNKRYEDVYLPSKRSEHRMGEIVLQIDVSGSISAKEIAHYNGHIKRIVEECMPTRVHVLYTDTQVQKHDVFDRPDELKIEYYSGGGTDMVAGYRFIEKEGIDPAVFITLTDGCTPFPTSVPCPSIWCIGSKHITAPDGAGETVQFEVM